MLESVTLAQVVEFVVKVLVDLSSRSVLDEQTTEDSQTSHPEDLAGHSGVLGTLSLTETSVSTLASGGSKVTGSGAGVHGLWLLDDETVGNELADGLAYKTTPMLTSRCLLKTAKDGTGW